LKFSSRQ